MTAAAGSQHAGGSFAAKKKKDGAGKQEAIIPKGCQSVHGFYSYFIEVLSLYFCPSIFITYKFFITNSFSVP
jgi:hypothetical protein